MPNPTLHHRDACVAESSFTLSYVDAFGILKSDIPRTLTCTLVDFFLAACCSKMNFASEMIDDLKKWLEVETITFKNAPFFSLQCADEQAKAIRSLFNAKASAVEESVQKEGGASLMETFRTSLDGVDVLWQDMLEYNRYRLKWSVTAGWSKSGKTKKSQRRTGRLTFSTRGILDYV